MFNYQTVNKRVNSMTSWALHRCSSSSHFSWRPSVLCQGNMEVSIAWGTPIAGWLTKGKTQTNMDEFGVPPFQEIPIQYSRPIINSNKIKILNKSDTQMNPALPALPCLACGAPGWALWRLLSPQCGCASRHPPVRLAEL